MSFEIKEIGIVTTPYKEKFAIPRQPNLVPSAQGYITLNKSYSDINMIRGLDGFSHIWLQFIFHQTQEKGWKPLVRPPRLGGNRKMGVFATRSPFRPNPLGLSVVKYLGYEQKGGLIRLHISGMDLLDQTPIVDIKPYVHYVDAIQDGVSGFACGEPIANLSISFTDAALFTLNSFEDKRLTRGFLEEVLRQDPRPAYKKEACDSNTYGVNLAGYDVRFTINETKLLVHQIEVAK